METIYDVMKDRLQVTETTVMVTVLSGPRQGDKTIYAEDGRVLYGTPIEGFTVDKAKLNSLCMVGEMECFVQPVENDPSVLVLGAGHVSRAITDLLLFIGCRVTVVDDRPEYVVPEFFDERFRTGDRGRPRSLRIRCSACYGAGRNRRRHSDAAVCFQCRWLLADAGRGQFGLRSGCQCGQRHSAGSGKPAGQIKFLHAP